MSEEKTVVAKAAGISGIKHSQDIVVGGEGGLEK